MSRTPSAAGPNGTDAAAPPLGAGAVLADRYEILRPLGTGGMGAVYLGRHRAMGRLCAIKILHPSLTRDREARERFTREAQSASRITHPNVCTVYDFGSTPEGQVYLVMEYIDGRSLGSILAERGTLPARRAVALVGQIAAGLDAAHALGIVHRDLKPDNVMVSGEAGDGPVKLVDFGIAKAAQPDRRSDVTAAGVVVGTPEYMAPEQFAGDTVDLRADVYALGLVFYRMVSGALPFQAATARDSLARRLTEAPEPLALTAPRLRLPPSLEHAVRRTLARDPADRFQSAGALADALTQSLRELPAEPGQAETIRLDAATERVESGMTPTRRWKTRRTPILFGTAVLAAAALAAAVLLPGPAGGGASDAGAGGPESLGGTATVDTGQAPAARPDQTAPVPPEPAPAQGLPQLPAIEEILDSATRGSARARAEQIYGVATLPDTLRAQAAFTVASAAFQDALATVSAEDRERSLADAQSWVQLAIDRNRYTPAGPGREHRLDRYESLRTQVRNMRKEPATP